MIMIGGILVERPNGLERQSVGSHDLAARDLSSGPNRLDVDKPGGYTIACGKFRRVCLVARTGDWVKWTRADRLGALIVGGRMELDASDSAASFPKSILINLDLWRPLIETDEMLPTLDTESLSSITDPLLWTSF